MRMFDQRWSSVSASGGQTGVYVSGETQHTVFYCEASTGVSTSRILIQSALSSEGPWATEASDTNLSSGLITVLRVSGPLLWVRPLCGSTGQSIRAIGV